jgi:hypothetical protein
VRTCRSDANPAETLAFVRSQQELWQPALAQVEMQFMKKWAAPHFTEAGAPRVALLQR